MLLHAPRFSKFLHGAAALFPNQVEKMPYWWLHNSDGTMSPATWEEMADDSDKYYDEVILLSTTSCQMQSAAGKSDVQQAVDECKADLGLSHQESMIELLKMGFLPKLLVLFQQTKQGSCPQGLPP